MLKNIFNSRNLIKIKNITGAVAVIVAVALVSPGVLSLVYSDGEIITDSDIAAYNSTKYAEEETIVANNGSNDGLFSGFETVPTVTPDPNKSTASEKNALSKKVKEIMKEKDAVAPKKPVVSYKSSKKNKATATPAPTAIPTEAPTLAPTAMPTAEPTMAPVTEPVATPESPVIPEGYVHYHEDDVERFEIYDIKTVIESNVLAFAAVPNEEYTDKIASVELVLMYNDVEVERRLATDVSNILEVFQIDVENTGYYEVEIFVTLTETEADEPALPVETEAPVSGEEPVEVEYLRQLSSVVYIIPEEIDGEVVENPLYEEVVPEENTEETLTDEPLSQEESSSPEAEPISEEPVQENVLTEDKIIEEETVAEVEPVQAEIPQE